MDMFDWMRQEHTLSQKKYPPEHDDEHGPDHLLEEIRLRLGRLRPLLMHPEMATQTAGPMHELAQVGNIVAALAEQFARRRPEEETPWRTGEEWGNPQSVDSGIDPLLAEQDAIRRERWSESVDSRKDA